MKVCSECFNDIELKQFIKSNSKEFGTCKYCKSEDVALIDVEEILDNINEIFSIYIESFEGKPLKQLLFEDWNFLSEKADVLLLDDLLTVSNSPIKNSVSLVRYTPEIEDCYSYWGILKEELKWNNRYLTNIDKLEELQWNQLLGSNVNYSENEVFYRARLHKDGAIPAFDINNMGPPSREKAIAGRANPMGIPYLYLSLDLDTTLYEVRATYLDEISIGAFTPKKGIELKLIDFTENISSFAGRAISVSELAKSKLLKRSISQDLAKPIRRYDSELEYIPTQFICEYVKYLYDVDGIIFDSSLHTGGKNLVLFNTDKVECKDVVKHQIEKIEIHSSSV